MRKCAYPACGDPSTGTIAKGIIKVAVCARHQDCDVRVGSTGIVFDARVLTIREQETARLAAAETERAVRRQRRQSRAVQRP